MTEPLAPRPGFDWSRVNWGGPDEPVSHTCSYCGDAIPEDLDDPNYTVPLRLWIKEGWAAVFCEHCQIACLQSFDEPAQPQHDEWRAMEGNDPPRGTSPRSAKRDMRG